jgi:Methyltransferase domain
MLMNNKQNIQYYNAAQDLLDAIDKAVEPTEVVADIGCGIVPMNYFRPKLHFLIEPWKEYSDILSHRHTDDKSVVILRVGALEALKMFADNSVDSIFLLDVIEHLDKEEGVKVLKEMERVARRQIVIFTPLGFMPQHMESGEQDGWGLSGIEVQEHRSGWLPEDFSPAYTFYICEEFHKVDYKSELLAKPFGAFYAVANLEKTGVNAPEILSDIRRILPAERELQQLQGEYQTLQATYQNLQIEHHKLQSEHHKLQSEQQKLQTELQLLKEANDELSSRYNKLTGMFSYRLQNYIKRLLNKIK